MLNLYLVDSDSEFQSVFFIFGQRKTKMDYHRSSSEISGVEHLNSRFAVARIESQNKKKTKSGDHDCPRYPQIPETSAKKTKINVFNTMS